METSQPARELARRIYMSSGLIMRACHRAFWPLFFVRLVTDVELSPLQLVLLGTVFELTILVSEIPTGVVADIFSRRLSVILSFFIVGAAMIMSAVVNPYWLLVISQVALGFGTTFESGAETAWITDELGSADEAEELILHRGQWQLVAGVVGILGFSGIAALTSLSTAMMLIGAVFVFWGFFLILRMPEAEFTRSPGEGWADFAEMLQRGFAHVRSVAALRILGLAVFVGGVAKEAIDRLDIKRLVDVGLPDDIDEAVVIGALVAVKLALAAAFLMITRARATGSNVVTAYVVLFCGVAAGILMLAHIDMLELAALGLILQGGFHFASEPLVTTWTNTFATSQARATIHSFMGQAEAFGEILGGIALGTVAQVFSVPAAMTLSALLFLTAAALAATTSRVWTSSLDQVGAG